MEYTPERVRSICRILVHVGHRRLMQPQTNQAQQRRSRQGLRLYYMSRSFCFHVEVLVEVTTQARRLIPLTQVTATVGLAADLKAAEDEANP